MKLPENQEERLKLKQEGLYDILASFFSGGTYNNIFLGLFSELNVNLKQSNEALGTLDQNTEKANQSLQSLNANLEKTHAQIKELNNQIKAAGDSSDRLATALNKITFWGAVIAGLSLFVAVCSVGLEYYKYFVASAT